MSVCVIEGYVWNRLFLFDLCMCCEWVMCLLYMDESVYRPLPPIFGGKFHPSVKSRPQVVANVIVHPEEVQYMFFYVIDLKQGLVHRHTVDGFPVDEVS